MATRSINQEMIHLWCLLLLLTAISGNAVAQHNGPSLNHQAAHPVYPPDTADIRGLKQSIALVMDLSVDELIRQVPIGSGIFFCRLSQLSRRGAGNGCVKLEAGYG